MKKIFLTLLLCASFIGFAKAQVCNCNDPLNILDGDLQVLFFHRTLVLDIGQANIPVEIFGNWFDSAGMPVSGPVNAMTNNDGFLEFEFFSPPAVAIDFDVHYNSGQGELSLLYMGSACEPCMAIIPTLNQWGIIWLVLLMMIVGVASQKKPSYQMQ
ncbi:MAG: IPTL-CTERM sorting domain-containing protein [Saprospiraceae bacterium]